MIKNVLILLIGFGLSVSITGQNHPCILVKTQEFEKLRKQADQWPWSVMVSKARESMRGIQYEQDLDYGAKCNQVFELGGAAALLYIIEPDKKENHIQVVQEHVARMMHDIRVAKETAPDPTVHGPSVGPAHATFMAYIVMDIMYPSLDPGLRQSMEADCDYIASNHHTAWWASKLGIEATMELYHHGPSQEFVRRKNKYRDYIASITTEDGVYMAGPGYTTSRLYMDGRSPKKLFMDVVEYQGFGDFYDTPKFQKLHEWIFGYAFTPFNRSYTFGDSPPSKMLDEWSAAALRVSRFSETAARYARFHLGGLSDEKIKGNVLHYLLYEKLPSAGLRPTSRIFPNGGAWLIDTSMQDESLTTVLWNINNPVATHNHFDVNAIVITAFGDFVLRNSGYDGWGRPDQKGWEWIHRTAASSNTITIGRQNHEDFRGGGISESLTGYGIEYASGHSGEAIPGGIHERHMVLIKPEGTTPGYVMLFDEVSLSDEAAETVTLHLHPNAEDAPLVKVDQMIYDWKVKTCNTDNDIRLMICLGDKSLNSTIRSGYLASYEECSRFTGKYLESIYPATTDAPLMIQTLIYPYLSGQTVPAFERIRGSACAGTHFRFNTGSSDYALKPAGDSEGRFDDMQFRAKGVYMRKTGDELKNYFALQGTELLSTGTEQYGFRSRDTVSIVCNGIAGALNSPGTELTLFYPRLRSILVDDHAGQILDRGQGWIRIKVPGGTHHFRIIAGAD